MLEALKKVKENKCSTDCSDEENCLPHWLVVQTHHDYCPEADIPVEIEDEFHNYDEVCEICEISRKPIEGAELCPVVDCTDDTGSNAYTDLVDGDCLSDCTKDGCKENYFLLLSTHDDCPHDALSTAAEKGYHDMEDACGMHVCSSSSGKDPLVCVPEEGEEGDEKGDEGGDEKGDEKDDKSGGSFDSIIFSISLVLVSSYFL